MSFFGSHITLPPHSKYFYCGNWSSIIWFYLLHRKSTITTDYNHYYNFESTKKLRCWLYFDESLVKNTIENGLVFISFINKFTICDNNTLPWIFVICGVELLDYNVKIKTDCEYTIVSVFTKRKRKYVPDLCFQHFLGIKVRIFHTYSVNRYRIESPQI